METYAKQSKPATRTLSERARYGQQDMAKVLQAYRNRATQLAALTEEDDQALQGKFTTQLQEDEDEETLQGKFPAQLQSAEEEESIQQKKENRTGLPDQLKTGVENLSGYSLDAVKVHYNSSKPAQLQALAYTQGTDIHVGPGQERYLGHEAWHVVQQMQGRVQPTTQMQGIAVNDNEGLEREADAVGSKAMSTGSPLEGKRHVLNKGFVSVLQRIPVPVPYITMKRNNIRLLGDDKYGHWWTEIDTNDDGQPEESYGWWPATPVGLVETFKGVPGELNGVTSFGGSATQDPHHGQAASDQTFHPKVDSRDPRTQTAIINDVKNVGNAWNGRNWQWVFGFGNNCHTFQKDILTQADLN